MHQDESHPKEFPSSIVNLPPKNFPGSPQFLQRLSTPYRPYQSPMPKTPCWFLEQQSPKASAFWATVRPAPTRRRGDPTDPFGKHGSRRPFLVRTAAFGWDFGKSSVHGIPKPSPKSACRVRVIRVRNACGKITREPACATLQLRQPRMRSLQDACAGARLLRFQGWWSETPAKTESLMQKAWQRCF